MKKLLYLLLALVGCKQENVGPTTVDGQVINRVTGKSIPNVQVYVDIGVSDGSLSGGFKRLYHGRTDSNGRFYTEFDEPKGWNPECGIIVNSSDTLTFFASASRFGTNEKANLTQHQDNKVTLYVAPLAYLALGIHNVNYVDDKDSINYYYGSKAINWGFERITFVGNEQGQSGKLEIPMGWIHFDWDVTRNGVTSYYHDSIWCKAGALTLYQINY